MDTMDAMGGDAMDRKTVAARGKARTHLSLCVRDILARRTPGHALLPHFDAVDADLHDRLAIGDLIERTCGPAGDWGGDHPWEALYWIKDRERAPMPVLMAAWRLWVASRCGMLEGVTGLHAAEIAAGVRAPDGVVHLEYAAGDDRGGEPGAYMEAMAELRIGAVDEGVAA